MTAMPPPQQAPPGSAPQQQPQQRSLPPTGLDQQLASMNQQYQQVQGAQAGFDPTAQYRQNQTGLQQGAGNQGYGASSLGALSNRLAQQYGLSIGRGALFDSQGNANFTPDQIAQASGGQETMGTAAAKMNYISEAIRREQQSRAQAQSVGALQQGLGQVQSRGRGSLAGMQSGFYQQLSQAYQQQGADFESLDFSYFIQKEQMDIAQELQRRQEKMAKKQARGRFIGGVALGIAGFATGNVAAGTQGVGMATGSAGGTGWF